MFRENCPIPLVINASTGSGDPPDPQEVMTPLLVDAAYPLDVLMTKKCVNDGEPVLGACCVLLYCVDVRLLMFCMFANSLHFLYMRILGITGLMPTRIMWEKLQELLKA